MSHLRNLTKVSSVRSPRSIWLTGTSRPQFLTRTPRTIFTTSRRSSVEPNQRHQEKPSEFELPRFEYSPKDDDGARPPWAVLPIISTLAFCLFGYIMYTVFEVAAMWPAVLGDDLRKGIKHRNQHNLPLSIQHLRNAWETTKTLTLKSFGTDPLLKTTGIAITLAGVLEDDGKKEEAYEIYKEALFQLQSAYLNLPPPSADAPQPDLGGMENLKLLTPPERMRAAALSHKLGSLASELKKPEEEEEKWLTWSVNAIMMAVMEVPAGSQKIERRAKKLHIMGGDMRLPSWARDHDIAAPFQALGKFHSDRGNRSYALPLYLQAVSILIPPPPLESSPEDRCRGAGLMRDISMFIAMSGDPETLPQAISWLQKGLDVINATPHSIKGPNECESAYLLLLYQLGLMQVLGGEYDKGRESFEAVLKQSKALKIRSLAISAQEELANLDSIERGDNVGMTV